MSRLMMGPDDFPSDVVTEQDQRPADETAQNTQTKFDRITGLLGLNDLQRPVPLVDGFLYSGTLAQLAGGPGTCKTFLTLAWSISLAAGVRSWEGHRIEKRTNVLYVAAEGASGLNVRIRAMMQSTGIPLSEVDGHLFVLPEAVQLDSTLDVAGLTVAVVERDVKLVVLDTRSLCTVGVDENSAAEQGQLIDKLLKMIRDTGCSVLVVHHTSRAGMNGGGAGRGSNAWDGAVWSDMRLTKDADTGVIRVVCEKHKDAPSGCAHEFVSRKWTVTDEYAEGVSVERDSDLETLVVTQANPDSSLLDTSKMGEVLRAFETHCDGDGLSVSKLEKLSGLPESTIRRYVKVLVAQGRLMRLGTDKRPLYAPPMPTLGDDDSRQADVADQV